MALWLVCIAGTFKRIKITGDTAEKRTLLVYNIGICTDCTLKYGCGAVVNYTGLMLKQAFILRIRLSVNINNRQSTFRDRKHIIEAKDPELPAGQFENMMTGF